MSRHLARACAIWLSLLIVMPFTAPFLTIDLLDLVAGANGHDGITAVAQPPCASVQNDDALVSSDGRRTVERFRVPAWATLSCDVPLVPPARADLSASSASACLHSLAPVLRL